MKKIFYISLTIILGILLSVIAHSFIEVQYLRWAVNKGMTVNFIRGCTLPVYFNYGLTVFGAVGGYFLGGWWWRIVYIEKRRLRSWKLRGK